MMPKARRPRYEVKIKGRRHFCDRQIDCLSEVVRFLSASKPDLLRTLSFHEGFRRRLVASRKEDLRTKKDRQDLVSKFAEPLVDGWWIWTNWNGDQVIQNMRLVCAIAGVTFGEDVKIRYEQWGKAEPKGDISDLGF